MTSNVLVVTDKNYKTIYVSNLASEYSAILTRYTRLHRSTKQPNISPNIRSKIATLDNSNTILMQVFLKFKFLNKITCIFLICRYISGILRILRKTQHYQSIKCKYWEKIKNVKNEFFKKRKKVDIQVYTYANLCAKTNVVLEIDSNS